jgi:Ca2+-binding RTX toxin-like protein
LIIGTDGNDDLMGTDASDEIIGVDGNDRISNGMSTFTYRVRTPQYSFEVPKIKVALA